MVFLLRPCSYNVGPKTGGPMSPPGKPRSSKPLPRLRGLGARSSCPQAVQQIQLWACVTNAHEHRMPNSGHQGGKSEVEVASCCRQAGALALMHAQVMPFRSSPGQGKGEGGSSCPWGRHKLAMGKHVSGVSSGKKGGCRESHESGCAES